MFETDRRRFLQILGAAAGTAMVSEGPAFAQSADAGHVTIAWPAGIPSWDPNQRFSPDIQSIYKMVYDQPLNYSTKLELQPNVVTDWKLSEDAMSLWFQTRDDVVFSDGSPLTVEDIAYTFHGRTVAGHVIDTASTWAVIDSVDVASPSEATFKFKSPMVTAPQWLGFLGSFIVSRAYVEGKGVDALRAAPLGSGPYVMTDYTAESRIVLEANPKYWGERPAITKVTVQIIKDPSARLAALQSGQVDLAVSLPVRDTVRLKKDPKFNAALNPITRVILLTIRSDGPFADKNVRLAAHHAIDKRALSRAFYGGAATPLNVIATPGTPGVPDGYEFPYDVEKAKELLKASGYSPENPITVSFGTFNGNFPSDYDITRAIAQMWEKVGIKASVEVIEYAKWFDLNRSGKLQDASLYSWDNATGDPEIYIGYLMNPHMPFNTFGEGEIPDRAAALFSEPDYDKRIAAYKQLNIDAVEDGAIVPLLQAVQTIAARPGLSYTSYPNGWILGQTMSWS